MNRLMKISATKRIIFGIGSNFGDRELFLQKAAKNLVRNLNLSNIKKSVILENKALLLPNAPKEFDRDFLNLVISADIDFDDFAPLKILEIIKKIEDDLGRINRGKWAPREIDIDILAIGDLNIDLGEKLQIPHSQLFNRDFFLKLFSEIEPELLKIIKNHEKRS